MKLFKRFRQSLSRYGIVIIMVVFIIGFTCASPKFFTFSNIINILRQVSPVGIAAVGMAMVIITGGIDMTAGSVVALVSVLSALLMTEYNLPVIVVIPIGLLLGFFVGLINGLAVTKLNIPSFIFTLAMMSGIRGVCYIITGGMPIFGFTKDFDFLGKGYLLSIPIPVIIMLVTFTIGWIVINKTRFGRYIYAIGGNVEATRLSGVKVHKNLVLTFAICGTLAALSGLIILSRLSSGQPSAGEDFAFDVVTAVVLGGISVTGGEGRFSGIFFGVIILGILSNGLTLLNVYDYFQMVIKCVVLIAAVGFDQYTKMNKKVDLVDINKMSKEMN